MFSNFFFSNIVPFLRYCGRNTVKPDRPDMTILRMRIACWAAHSQYSFQVFTVHYYSQSRLLTD